MSRGLQAAMPKRQTIRSSLNMVEQSFGTVRQALVEQVEQSLVTLLDGSGALTGQVCACLGAGGERESGWGLDCRSDLININGQEISKLNPL